MRIAVPQTQEGRLPQRLLRLLVCRRLQKAIAQNDGGGNTPPLFMLLIGYSASLVDQTPPLSLGSREVATSSALANALKQASARWWLLSPHIL